MQMEQISYGICNQIFITSNLILSFFSIDPLYQIIFLRNSNFISFRQSFFLIIDINLYTLKRNDNRIDKEKNSI